jgi:hypothetical protein
MVQVIIGKWFVFSSVSSMQSFYERGDLLWQLVAGGSCSVEDEWTWDEHKGREGGDGENEKDTGGGEWVGVW